MGLPSCYPLLLAPALAFAAGLQDPPPAEARPELSAQELRPPEPAGKPEAPAKEAPSVRTPLYSLAVNRQDAEATILEFARKSGVNVTFLDRPATLISLVFKDLPFEEAFRHLLEAAELTSRKLEGEYLLGSTLDMRLRFPDGEKTMDAPYRCRRINPSSLISTLRSLFPSDLAMAIGPQYLTPPLDSNSSVSGTTGGGKTLSGTSDTFKTHDVVFSGPTELVRRALTLARKFDRPRRMARIIVKVVEVSTNEVRNLGVDWMDYLPLIATEQSKDPNASAIAPGSTATKVIDGIRVGRFSHSPLVISATLNALEAKGYSKTVANPTILLLDGERSYIQAGSKYTYPVFTMNSSSGQPEYSTKEFTVGVYLQVGLQMGVDNDLTLSLYPQVTFSAGKNVINGAEYPIVGTREEQTTVRANHGEMIVLGGLLENEHTVTRTGLPFLSTIPILGRLFSSTNNSGTNTELMIFVTPEIVEDRAQDAKVQISVKDGA